MVFKHIGKYCHLVNGTSVGSKRTFSRLDAKIVSYGITVVLLQSVHNDMCSNIRDLVFLRSQ